MRTSLLSLLALLALSIGAPAASAATLIPGIESENVVQAGSYEEIDEHFKEMKRIGVKSTRLLILWDQVAYHCQSIYQVTPQKLGQHKTPCYGWGRYDYVFDVLDRYDITPLVTIYGTPPWLNPGPEHVNNAYIGKTDAEFKEFNNQLRAFSVAAVSRYPTAKHWMIWNEPNGGAFFQPMSANAPYQYAEMYVSAAAAMKRVRPDIKMAPGPTAPGAAGGIKPAVYIPILLQELGRRNAGPLVDAYAHNMYPADSLAAPAAFANTGDNIPMGAINKLTMILDASPVTLNKPLWATEFAYQVESAEEVGVSRHLQARYLADSYRILHQSNRVTFALWYVYKDPADKGDWQSGLLDHEGRKRPSFHMYPRMVSVYKQDDKYVFWGRSSARNKNAFLVSKDLKSWHKLKGSSTRGAFVAKLSQQTPYLYVKLVGGPFIRIDNAVEDVPTKAALTPPAVASSPPSLPPSVSTEPAVGTPPAAETIKQTSTLTQEEGSTGKAMNGGFSLEANSSEPGIVRINAIEIRGNSNTDPGAVIVGSISNVLTCRDAQTSSTYNRLASRPFSVRIHQADQAVVIRSKPWRLRCNNSNDSVIGLFTKASTDVANPSQSLTASGGMMTLIEPTRPTKPGEISGPASNQTQSVQSRPA